MINLGADGVFVTVAFDYWITSRGRALSLAEMARFQGVDKCGVSRTQFASMLGNSVTLTVMMKVLKNAISSTRLD